MGFKMFLFVFALMFAICECYVLMCDIRKCIKFNGENKPFQQQLCGKLEINKINNTTFLY